MHTHFTRPQRLAQALLIAAAALAGATALAAGKSEPPKAQARYEQERAVCTSGRSNQDRATCLREAGAALAESRRGGLDADGAAYADNQRLRCGRLSGDDELACQARMQGLGTTSGSAAEGGIYRELVTRETVLPAKPGPAMSQGKPMPMPMPDKGMPMPMPMPMPPAK
jgi:hypothetical protein